MGKLYYYGLKRLFVAFVFVVVGSSTLSAQKFETHKIYLSDNEGLTETVRIKPAAKFSIKKDNRHSWAKYEELNAAIKISVTANTSKKDRSCTFVLLDKTNTPVDTLEVIQTGKNATTVSKATTHSKSTTSSQKASSKTTGGRCAATTKKGTRCSRNASAGSRYCWQHNK